MSAELPKLIAVVGPTASGKSALAERICMEQGREIVNCDAKQLYRGMDVGTNKEVLSVRQHLLDVAEPGDRVSVAAYQQLAYAAIGALHGAGLGAVLCGGSMQYASAVLEGYRFAGPGSRLRAPKYRPLVLLVEVPRDELRRRIAARTARWLERGLLEEVARLRVSAGDAWLYRCGLEYRAFLLHLRGELSLEQASAIANGWQMQYVRRQETWWRHHGAVSRVGSLSEGVESAAGFLRGYA